MPTPPRGFYVDFRRTPEDNWRADLRMQLTNGGTAVRVSGTDEDTGGEGGPGLALQRAVSTARSIVNDPAIANLLPTGTLTAIQAVRSLARAARRGVLGHVINGKPLYQHFKGPFGRLAKALHIAHKKKRGPALSGGPLRLVDARQEGCE